MQNEIQEMADQLEVERRLVGDATTKTLLREMFKIPGNRNRALISVALMVFQQMTGVNAIVSLGPFTSIYTVVLTITDSRTITLRKFSITSAWTRPTHLSSPLASMALSSLLAVPFFSRL